VAISEACKYEIEENVDKACENKGVSKSEAFKDLQKFYNKIGVEITFGSIKTKYYKAKKEKEVSNETIHKPMKKHTKPEVKKQLKVVAKEAADGKISDDDMKILDSATAKAITEGKAAVRVGTATATAVKRENKKKQKTKRKEVDNFKRLNNHLKTSLDGLTIWADGQMHPESEDEAECARAILAKGTYLIIQYARLGTDIQGIYDTFIQGENENERQEFDQPRIVN
jgi:hypothetical protein